MVATKRIGGYRHLTLTAPGVPERFRAGNFVAVTVDGPRRPARAVGAPGPRLERLRPHPRRRRRGRGAAAPPGSPPSRSAPGSRSPDRSAGRSRCPRTPCPACSSARATPPHPLFPLAERLRERGCAVSLVVSAPDEARLLSALEARRSARSVTVLTADGSVGQRGTVADHVDDLVRRSDADVVYAAGPTAVLRAAAAAAERAGAWSQVAVEVPTPCGTGLCHGCPLPVVGEDGVDRVVRACAEGPVVRGDRVRWDAL